MVLEIFGKASLESSPSQDDRKLHYTYLKVSTCFLSTEVSLVRSITAVVLTVAFPGAGNAAAIITTKLTGLAGHIRAALLIWKKAKNQDK